MGERRSRGDLEADVKSLCDDFVSGTFKVPDDKPLTAYRAAQALKDRKQLDEMPSSGAVSYVFDRWREIGFANFSEKPYAFVDYTDAARTDGLGALKAAFSKQKREAKKALAASPEAQQDAPTLDGEPEPAAEPEQAAEQPAEQPAEQAEVPSF